MFDFCIYLIWNTSHNILSQIVYTYSIPRYFESTDSKPRYHVLIINKLKSIEKWINFFFRGFRFYAIPSIQRSCEYIYTRLFEMYT